MARFVQALYFDMSRDRYLDKEILRLQRRSDLAKREVTPAPKRDEYLAGIIAPLENKAPEVAVQRADSEELILRREIKVDGATQWLQTAPLCYERRVGPYTLRVAFDNETWQWVVLWDGTKQASGQNRIKDSSMTAAVLHVRQVVSKIRKDLGDV